MGYRSIEILLFCMVEPVFIIRFILSLKHSFESLSSYVNASKMGTNTTLLMPLKKNQTVNFTHSSFILHTRLWLRTMYNIYPISQSKCIILNHRFS